MGTGSLSLNYALCIHIARPFCLMIFHLLAEQRYHARRFDDCYFLSSPYSPLLSSFICGQHDDAVCQAPDLQNELRLHVYDGLLER
jgi:hypothetical protein